MLYCFLDEDLIVHKNNNEFVLQSNYAKSINKFCCIDSQNSIVIDDLGNQVNLNNRKVLLRVSYDKMEIACEILKSNQAILIEDIKDRDIIEKWYNFGISTRKIIPLCANEILYGIENIKDKKIVDFLRENERVFLKSKKKSFSVTVSSSKILNKDREFTTWLAKKIENEEDILLLSKEYTVKHDSLGIKEARFFVFENEIINCSRAIHSLVHNVPRSLLYKANEVVERISSIECFPKHYALDIGMFCDDDEWFTDVVEINPISNSMCYVNNSVFTEVTDEIASLHNRLNLGLEYCLDAIHNPTKYTSDRISNDNYSYSCEDKYKF